MSDFDFDKSFADDLRKGVLIEFVEADWENLAARLDIVERGKHRRRRFVLLAFPVAASAALLLMGLGLWQMAERVEALQSELTQLRPTSPAAVRSNDTTLHHVSVIQYDTIYRTVMIREGRWAVGHQSADSGGFNRLKIGSAELAFNDQERHSNRIAAAPRSQDSLAHILPFALQPDSMRREGESLVIRSPQPKSFDSLAFLPVESPSLAHVQQFKLPEIELPPFHSPAKKPLTTMIYRLRPHNVALGVTAGTVWPQVSGAQSSPGFTGGLAGQVAFGEHIRLTGEFRWSRNWFKIKNGDQNTPDIPTLTPPTPDDVLEYVQVKQPSLEYALGLRYQLRPEQKLQPYLALAWAGANTLEQTLQYEFHNPMTETETLVELPYTEQNVFRSRWQFGVGMEWPFGKRLAAGAEAFWQSPIGQGGFLEGSRLGLKANVFYFL